jgi:hypothetical protein
MLPPVFDNHLGFKTVPEPFHRQAFVAKLGVSVSKLAQAYQLSKLGLSSGSPHQTY